jgi:hypothetical protein
MKNILLVFPFLSGCFIIANLGLVNISPNPGSEPEISSTNARLSSSEIFLSPESLSAPFPCDVSRMVAYNMTSLSSPVHAATISLIERNSQISNESTQIIKNVFLGK